MKTRIFILLFGFLCTDILYSQTLDLTRSGLGARLRSQQIAPSESRLNNEKLLNLRTNYFSRFDSSINHNGKVFVLDNQLIKEDNTFFRKVELPFINDIRFRKMYLNSEGTRLTIQRWDVNTREIILNNFNVNTELNVNEISFPATGGFIANSNSTAFIFAELTDSEFLFKVVKIMNDEFTIDTAIKFTTENTLTGSTIKYFSSVGNRIFFESTLIETREKGLYIVDRQENGWSEPREWQLFDEQGNELIYSIFDIANNGRTLLLSNVDEGYALTHEINGKWSIPEQIGYLPKSHDRVQISENGKVIVVETVKRSTENVRLNDIFVFLQNPAGKWIQRQVNDPQLEVFDGAMLSDDGTQLFWLPANTSSVPGAEEYK